MATPMSLLEILASRGAQGLEEAAPLLKELRNTTPRAVSGAKLVRLLEEFMPPGQARDLGTELLGAYRGLPSVLKTSARRGGVLEDIIQSEVGGSMRPRSTQLAAEGLNERPDLLALLRKAAGKPEPVAKMPARRAAEIEGRVRAAGATREPSGGRVPAGGEVDEVQGAIQESELAQELRKLGLFQPEDDVQALGRAGTEVDVFREPPLDPIRGGPTIGQHSPASKRSPGEVDVPFLSPYEKEASRPDAGRLVRYLTEGRLAAAQNPTPWAEQDRDDVEALLGMLQRRGLKKLPGGTGGGARKALIHKLAAAESPKEMLAILAQTAKNTPNKPARGRLWDARRDVKGRMEGGVEASKAATKQASRRMDKQVAAEAPLRRRAPGTPKDFPAELRHLAQQRQTLIQELQLRKTTGGDPQLQEILADEVDRIQKEMKAILLNQEAKYLGSAVSSLP